MAPIPLKTKTPLDEPIAIIGFGCRLPGGVSSPSKLWDLISNPQDVLTEIPESRFNINGFCHPDGEHHGHCNVKYAYTLQQDLRTFDASFFNISANEAGAMDPQQRILLECVYEALEHGGQNTNDLKASDTAVYVGTMVDDYTAMQGRDLNTLPTYWATGTSRAILSNRISYVFDWRGPSLTLDTACSSSLVAVHQAVQTLRSGVSGLAIAAGANLLLGPEMFIAGSSFHMLSPRGRSQMWDGSADGYARGDGVAAVILKRLSDAIRDGDNVTCVIRETGVNQDGHTKGLTVPSSDAQVDLIETTYARAGLDLGLAQDRPQYFEAHGTGTSTGDPLEAEAIFRSIGEHIEDGQAKLHVNSIKSLLGHTEGCAGIAGLLQVSLALQHSKIPPNMLFDELNPAIEPFHRNLHVPTKLADWPAVQPGHPRRASLSSFGFGGTNAHAIIESFDANPQTINVDDKPSGAELIVPFVFSANSEDSLKHYLQAMIPYLHSTCGTDLRSIRQTLHTRKTPHAFRIAIPGQPNPVDLMDALKQAVAPADWKPSMVSKINRRPLRILGIFTGQGAQWPGMSKELVEHLPFVSRRVNSLEDFLSGLPANDRPKWSLSDELFANEEISKLSDAAISQPVCAAVQIILVDLLHAVGVRFSAIVGHSSGEIACAYAAGVLSDRDALLVAYYRGLHSRLATRNGGMIATDLSPEGATALCQTPEYNGRICVAACNSPKSSTLSGDFYAIQDVKEQLVREGRFARVLRVDKAYHSPHMQLCRDAYLESLREAGVSARQADASRCKWFSSVLDGRLVEKNCSLEALSGPYWIDNMVQKVSFLDVIRSAFDADTADVALEVGPHEALKGPVRETVDALGISAPTYLSCLVRKQDARTTFSKLMGSLWMHGYSHLSFADLERIVHGLGQDQLPPRFPLPALPAYEWDHDRILWTESARSIALRSRALPGHALLGTVTPDSTNVDLRWHNVISLSRLPWISGHMLRGQIIFPGTAYVAMAVEATCQLASHHQVQGIEVEQFVIDKAIILDGDTKYIETQLSLHVKEESNTSFAGIFRIHSSQADGTMTLNAKGRIRVALGNETQPKSTTPIPFRNGMIDVDYDSFYAELRKLGYQYKGPFHGLRETRRVFGRAHASVARPNRNEMHPSERQLLFHPGVLDAAIQSLLLAASSPGDGRIRSLHVPVQIARITLNTFALQMCEDGHFKMDCAQDLQSTELGIVGDVALYSNDGQHALFQLDGIRLVATGAANAASDVQTFHENVMGLLAPDGEKATGGARVPHEEVDKAWACERIALFYLQRLVKDVTQVQEDNATWHYKRMMAFAKRAVGQVKSGQHPLLRQEWSHDNVDTIVASIPQFDSDVVVRLMRAVGENLAASLRGETHIIQHMKKDNMLDEYYATYLKNYSTFIAEIVGQLSHVHPNMQILEIGAGTGSATKSVLPRLAGAVKEYHFTDISSGFFETAKAAFTEYAPYMRYQVLDAERDVCEQGFSEHSYDLVIASQALHATTDLAQTLRNVHRLLRPGGYLVMLEGTSSTASLVPSFLFGGLSGWWLGAATGREWSAWTTPEHWHQLFLENGFTGIETQTPEQDLFVQPINILVTRATNEHVDMLMSPISKPSPKVDFGDLVVVSGSTQAMTDLAAQIACILQQQYSSVRIARQPDSFTPTNLRGRSKVLYLSDFADPILQSLTPASFEAYKKLYLYSDTVLMVTQGRRRSTPYANASVGLARVIAKEMPHLSIRSIDLDSPEYPDARFIAEEFIRWVTLIHINADNVDFLWPMDTEIYIDTAGSENVARVKAHAGLNQHYNAASRAVTMNVNSSTHHLRWKKSKMEAMPQRQLRSDCRAEGQEDVVHLKTMYTSNTPVSFSHMMPLYPCVGIDSATNGLLLALTDNIESTAQIPANLCAPLSGTQTNISGYLATASIRLLFTGLTAALHLSAGDTVILLDPPRHISEATDYLQREEDIRFIHCSSVGHDADSHHRCLRPDASVQEIRRVSQDLVNIKAVVNFSSLSCDNGAHSEHWKTALSGNPWFGHATQIVAYGLRAEAAFKDILTSISTVDDMATGVPIIPAAELPNQQPGFGELVDWTSDQLIPAALMETDYIPLLKDNATYILFGFAGVGSLGVSLCEYLIRQGARYIVLTSRRPNPDAEWIADCAAKGARVEIRTNDITDEGSVKALVADLRDIWPPIAGVANGAMVLNDAYFESMSFEQMTQTLGPKIDGSRIMDEVFQTDLLDFWIMMGSLTCVVGNAGQSNYSAANMYMSSLVAQRRARGLPASVIHMGTIMGAGYITKNVTDNVLEQLRRSGSRRLSERDFHVAFANAILASQPGSTYPWELILGLEMPATIADDGPSWTKDPRFSTLRRDVSKIADTQAPVPVIAEPPRDRLRGAQSAQEVASILTDALISKFQSMLQLSPQAVRNREFLLQQSSDMLGVDSLVAVEINWWILREMQVTISVSEILGAPSIGDIVEKIIERLSSKMTPQCRAGE